MKTIRNPRFNIILAEHYGMCFGVRNALKSTENLLEERPATILGELAHNKSVMSRLSRKGAKQSKLTADHASTPDVVITAHGASDRDRDRWANASYWVHDTTCPLVHKAHKSLAMLVAAGYFPVVIGKKDHVEVKGLVGDFPEALVVLDEAEIKHIPKVAKLGIVSQTTQPIDKVLHLVTAIQLQRPSSEVLFKDTVCQPTKDRQRAMRDLCRNAEFILAVGGKNSNNTSQLAKTARLAGCQAKHIEFAEEIDPEWFVGVSRVGVTAGTSTLDKSVELVVERLQEIAQVELVAEKV